MIEAAERIIEITPQVILVLEEADLDIPINYLIKELTSCIGDVKDPMTLTKTLPVQAKQAFHIT